MKLRWPPPPLGLGPPLNLALLAPDTRARLARGWWLPPVVGLATALALFATDRLLFGGATMAGTPALSAHPPVGSRVLVAFLGSLFEELVFRVGLASVVAWIAYGLLRRALSDPERVIRVAQGIGVLAAVSGVGLMHVGQVGQPSEFWRIMTINAVGHVVYGWLYWRRGFELALLTHAVVTLVLYIGWPALR
jgi:hypothetical protein